MRNSDLAETTGSVTAPAQMMQFVTFILENELYGIDIQRVEEIVGMPRVSPVPDMPRWMIGVMNLRGRVIPVIDMRKRFRMPDREYTDTTVVIIVSIKGRFLGLIVDAVADVNTVESGEIQATPHFSMDVESAVIRGICPVAGAPVVLLDLDRLISVEDMAMLDSGSIS